MLAAALVAWAVAAAWLVYEARQTGAALLDTLKTSGPASGLLEPAAREKLLLAAEKLRDGAFHRAASLLRPPKPLSPSQRLAAERFFGRNPDLKKRFLAVASAARTAEEKGLEVRSARTELARALASAAARDGSAATADIAAAERSLDTISVGTPSSLGGDDQAAVARLAAAIGPSFLLAQDLLTEGHETTGRIVRRAAWEAKENRFAEAAALLNLAACLLGVDASAPPPATMPEWFMPLAEAPSPSGSRADAEAAVALAEAMAASEHPGVAVMAIIQRARRQADASRYGEARWWARVALAALGMTDEPAAEAAGGTAPETEGASQ